MMPSNPRKAHGAREDMSRRTTKRSDSEGDDSDSLPPLIPCTSDEEDLDDEEEYSKKSANKGKVKGKEASKKPKSDAECADIWYKLKKDDKEKHIHVMKVYLLSPFLFGIVHQDDKWIKWAYESGLLPSKSSFETRELEEKYFDAVDLIETAFNVLAENALGENKDGLVKILNLIGSPGVSMSQHLDKAVICAESFLAFTNLRDKIKLKPGVSKKQGDVALLLAHYQVTDHIKQLALGTNLVEDFTQKCKKEEANTTDDENAGNASFANGKYTAASSIYTKALHMSPYNHLLYGNRAHSCLKTRDLRHALSDGRRAVVLKPDWHKAQYRYAQAFYELGDITRAKETNRAARKICSEKKDLEGQFERFEKGFQATKEAKGKATEKKKAVKHSKLLDDLPDLVDPDSSDTSSDDDSSACIPDRVDTDDDDSTDSTHDDSEDPNSDISGYKSDDSSARKKNTSAAPLRKKKRPNKKVRQALRETMQNKVKQEEKAKKEEEEKKVATGKENKKMEKKNKKTKATQVDPNGNSHRKREFTALLKQELNGDPKPEREWPSDRHWKLMYPDLFPDSSSESEDDQEQILADTHPSVHGSPFLAHDPDTVATFPLPPHPAAGLVLATAPSLVEHGSSHGQTSFSGYLPPHVDPQHHSSPDIHTHHHNTQSTIFTPERYPYLSGSGQSTVKQGEFHLECPSVNEAATALQRNTRPSTHDAPLSVYGQETVGAVPLPHHRAVVGESSRKRKNLEKHKDKDSIPALVRARGEKALAAYHRALETGGSTYDKRVKVLLVGQDRVGKTSLGKALRGELFDEAELSTEGVQMIPAIKNAGTGAWRNPPALEHTTVFDHKVAAKTAEDLLSKHSVQPAKKQPRTVASNKTDQLFVEDENPISSKADEGKTQLPQQEGASREVKENQVQKNQIPISSKADEGKSQLPQQEEVPSDVKENQAQKNHDEDLENQKKPFGIPDEIAIILEEHLEKNEGDTNEKIWPIIWDFAGQDIYRAVHPIFMSSDDIYLLVFDLTKSLSEKAECRVNVGHKEYTATPRDGEDTNLDHLCRWMDLIHSLKKDFQSDGLSYPPVILVGTHADRVVDPRRQINSLAEGKCSVVFDEDTYLPHIADYFPIDNTGKSADKKEITGLRKKILELADKMPHTKRKIPLPWHRVEKEICQPVWQQEKYLLLESFQEKIVSRYCTFEGEGEGDLDELVYFLHGRGTIVYHEHEHHKKKVGLIVLNPQWLISVLCEIIKVKPDDNELLCIRKDRKKLAKEGVLRERLINHTCSKENVGLIKDTLISLMDKFNLICKWPEKAEETKKGESQTLVPCMLTTFYEGEGEKGNAAPIYLTFQTKYVPYGLFCRLVVLFGKTSQFKNVHNLEYANEAKIALDNANHVLQLLCYKTVIKLQIADHGSAPPQKLYYDVWSQLKKFLEKLRKECHWLHSMSYKLCARCTVCMGKATKPCARHEERSCRHHDCGHYIPLEQGLLCCTPGKMLEMEPLKPWIRAIEHVSKNLPSSRPESHDESWSLQVTESLKTASNPPEVTVTVLRNENLPGKSVLLDKRQLPIDILLLTVKDWEFLACISCFNRGFRRSYCEELRQDVYLGEIGNDDMMLKIAVVQCYTGSTVPQGPCVGVMKPVEVLGPKAVFSVGCCGGLDPAKFKLGDVVVSVKLITYSSSKVTDNGITERGVRVPLKANISKLMLSAAHGWKAPLKSPKEFEVEMHRGVFLSGPESVDSSARREKLHQRFSEADVIEMEGEGVYAAAQELDIPWTIIKGVSNYADGRLFEPNPWKKFASLMAASLTAHILSNPVAFKDWPHYQSTVTKA